ncbi:MAG: hypothetical protein WB014_01945 [Methanosarcina sp.]
MTLPEICPLDESQICKGRECHLFCLEWRTREPTCLIGYSTTSKIKSGKADRKKDTYAEETFRKLGRQPLPKRKNVSEKGDWTPTRPTEKPLERPVERKEEIFTQNPNFQETIVRNPDPRSEINHEERLNERYSANEAERASIRLEARLKKEQAEQNPIICAKTQPKVQEKPKAQEKVISRDKHTTIFASCDADEKDSSYPSGREEKTKKPPENRERRKKLDEVMEIDLPDVYDEEFWS